MKLKIHKLCSASQTKGTWPEEVRVTHLLEYCSGFFGIISSTCRKETKMSRKDLTVRVTFLEIESKCAMSFSIPGDGGWWSLGLISINLMSTTGP